MQTRISGPVLAQTAHNISPALDKHTETRRHTCCMGRGRAQQVGIVLSGALRTFPAWDLLISAWQQGGRQSEQNLKAENEMADLRQGDSITSTCTNAPQM